MSCVLRSFGGGALLLTALAAGLCLPGAEAGDVQLSTLSGQRFQGALTAILPDAVELQTAGGTQRTPLAEVEALDFPNPAAAVRPKFLVELLDGSRLAATAFSLAAGKAQLELTSGVAAADLPTRAMKHVKFVTPADDPAEAKAWAEVIAAEVAGDVLVVRKKGEGGELSLDQLEGAILGVSPDGVKFNFDGDEITVKFEKLAGLVFFQPSKRTLAAPRGRLFDVAGSQWVVRSVELKDQQLVAVTPAGLSLAAPLSALARLDLSSGNIAYLAELARAQLRDQPAGPALALTPRSLEGSTARWFTPQVELFAQPVSLGGKSGASYRRLLALPAPAELTLNVPEGFERLRGLVGLDPAHSPAGAFELAIVAGGKVIWSQSFSASRKGELVELDLPLAGAQRLALRTRPVAGQGIGSWIHLYEARLTK